MKLRFLLAVGVLGLAGACLDQPFATNVDLPLQVLQLAPTDGAVDVGLGSAVTATFNLPVVEASLAGNFLVEDITVPASPVAVAGTLTYLPPEGDSAPKAVFQPDALLPYSGTFRVTLTTGIGRDTDPAGNLLRPATSTFTTEDPPALLLLSSDPGSGSTQVSLDTGMTLTFSEAIDCATFTAADVTVLETLDDGTTGAAVTAAVASCTGAVVTLTFSRPFEQSATVDVTLGEGIESVRATTRGGQLDGGAVITFTTEDPPPLLVFQSDPGNGSTGIGFNTDLTLEFSENVDCATIDAALATVTVTEVFSAEVAVLRGVASTTHTVTRVSCADDTAVLAFSADFELASTVTVTLPGTIASARATLSGGQLNDGAPHVIGFEIIPFPPVEVIDVQPPGPQIVANTAFTVTFNQDIFVPIVDRTNPEVDVFLAELTNAGDVPTVATAVALTCVNCTQGDTYVFAPTAPLTAGKTYALVIRGGSGGVVGAAGGSIALGDFIQRYIVVGGGLLVSTDPVDGATDVPVTSTVCATFLINVQPAIIANANAFIVSAENDVGGQTALAGTLAFFGVDPLTGLPDTDFTSNKVCFTPTPSTIPCRENDELLPANTLITMTFSFVDPTDAESIVNEARSFTTAGLPTLIDSFFETIPEVNLTGELTTEVPVNGTFILVFESAVDVATLDAIRLETAAGALVASTVALDPTDDTMVRITATALLAFNSGFRIEVDGGVSAGVLFTDGRYLADDVAISFTTSPANAARSTVLDIENASEVTVSPVVFDRPMFLPSVNSETVTARDNSTASAVEAGVATFIEDPFTAVFTAQPSYVGGNSVTLTIGTGARDFLGNPLPAPVSVTWESIGGTAAANSNPPDVVDLGDVAPTTGAQAATQTFRLTMPPSANGKLANRMVPSSFNTTSLLLRQTAACAAGGAAHDIATKQRFTVATVAQGSESVEIIPQERLRTGCSYTLTLKQRFFANIYLQQASDTAPDVVVNVTGEAVRPTRVSGNVINAAGGAPLVVTFSEPIDPATLAGASVSDGTAAVTGTFTTAGNTVVFTPASFFRTGLTYTATFPTTVADLAGNTLAAAQTVTLTTETVRPVPPATATTVGDSLVLAFGADALDPASVVPTTFGVGGIAGTVLVRDAATDAAIEACVHAVGATIIVDHIDAATGTAIEIVVTTSVTDEAGNAVATQTVIAATAP